MTRSVDDVGTITETALRRIAAGHASMLTGAQLRELADVRALVDASEEVRRAALRQLAARKYTHEGALLASFLARKRLQLTGEDLEILLLAHGREERDPEQWVFRLETVRSLTRHIERSYSSLAAPERSDVGPLVERLADVVGDPATATRLRALLGGGEDVRLNLIDETDPVGREIRTIFSSSTEALPALAAAVDLFAAFPATGRPPRRWRAEADRVRAMLSDPRRLVHAILDASLTAPDTEEHYAYQEHHWTAIRFATAANESFICGAVTFAGTLGEPDVVPKLGALALKSVTVVGGSYGHPRSLRVANACAHAIADVDASSSISELLALERSVTHGTLLKQIRDGIGRLASARGVTREQLLERAVASHGLDPDGSRRTPLSRGTAVISFDGRNAALQYIDERGTYRKSFPADVKQADAEALRTLRSDVAAIRKTIAGERHRLDRLMAADRRWLLSDWRSSYLDHPITGRMTPSLIWTFEHGEPPSITGIPVDEATVLTNSSERVEVPRNAAVRLWHAIDAAPDDVRAWRRYLVEHEIVQPFKQAFRELYVVTPGELETRVYSNRFAGHIFRQVQARALMKRRGWKPVPVAWWDDGIDRGVARREFDDFGIRAEFFFDPLVDVEPGPTDLYPYCTSDQVRFVSVSSDDPIALDAIPRVVFTETMRDVDLFVAVTSIGADPEWLDRREGRRFQTYWHDFSFGELTEAARLRREVLENLIPRLAISERCSIVDRYLTVRGDIRRYKIHLGSGNVLMSPNDEYLCIVGARDSRAEKLFLPFDDDPVLSLILSKAFLLANDANIADETISAQIRRG